ncbi:MAG TPA: ATP-binding cassette domain-containing protein, partial [Clostridia bacterium]
GSMTIGQLITFNVLLAYFLDPVRNLISLQPMMQTAVVASDRLGEILDLELEKKKDEGALKPETLKGDIEIRNLEFRYGLRKPVLININLSIKQGEKVAFVGESGSGKTTLVKLLMKFYNVENGEILLNGINLKEIDITALRDKIAYISQDTFFFSGSIRENLSLAMDDLDISDIKEASAKAEADEFISSLYQGYETLLEENASNLSGGQRQRLAITRALLKKPDIFIMDEATSNLDSITEKAVEKTINEQSMGITTIIIAHRLSTIKRCDRIFVMDKGQIAESGTHKELMEFGGIYYNLWKEQFSE